MKVTINTTEPQSREIDWSKPMVVTDGKDFIRTNGDHSSAYFAGMSMIEGVFSRTWGKYAFTPCTTPVIITFENEL